MAAVAIGRLWQAGIEDRDQWSNAIGSASLGVILKVKKPAMKKPTRMEVVRRAYELWQKAGQPEGRDQEFYHQAERELESESKDPETPENI